MSGTYSIGTISVGAGSTTVTGTGTQWASFGVREGDFLIADGLSGVIASVESNTSLTLARGWPGAGLSSVNYDIMLVDDAQRSLATFNDLRLKLGSGSLQSLAGLAAAANEMPYWTGAGVMGKTGLTSAGRSLLAQSVIKQTDSGDDTAGRLLTPGAGGILGAAPKQHDKGWTSFDQMVVGGLWSLGQTDLADGPLGAAAQSYNGVCMVWQRVFTTGMAITQIVNQNGDIYFRSEPLADIGTATWHKLLDTSDIESGSNANGTYSRLDDGRLICISPDIASQDVTTSVGGIYRTASPVTWNLPIAMAATAEWGGYVVSMGNSQTHWGALRVTGASSCEITTFGPSSVTGRTVRAIAIGR